MTNFLERNKKLQYVPIYLKNVTIIKPKPDQITSLFLTILCDLYHDHQNRNL